MNNERGNMSMKSSDIAAVECEGASYGSVIEDAPASSVSSPKSTPALQCVESIQDDRGAKAFDSSKAACDAILKAAAKKAAKRAAGDGISDDNNDSIYVEVPIQRNNKSLGYRFVKRTFDIAFSGAFIVVMAIPAVALCVLIVAETPGNPIYKQKRVGRIGRDGKVETFDMYKFRSMVKDADARLDELRELNEADGPLFKIKDDPRITRIGRFIRKHSIDETPQFLNVLAGHMSLVGPRPPLPKEVAEYDGRAMQRLSVKPGLTGYWQVSGRSDLSFPDMVELDLKYIEDRSFLLDLSLIARTVGVMVTGEGAC